MWVHFQILVHEKQEAQSVTDLSLHKCIENVLLLDGMMAYFSPHCTPFHQNASVYSLYVAINRHEKIAAIQHKSEQI